MLLLCLLPLGSVLRAAPLPDYVEAGQKLSALWQEKFPVKPLAVTPDGKRRVIRALYRGRWVYYYRFQVQLPRPVVKGEKLERRPGRTVETWLRYRPGLAEPYDVTFVREDLLPGKRRRNLHVPDRKRPSAKKGG